MVPEMTNIHDINQQLEQRGRKVRDPLDNSGGPPDDPRMEERVKKLEDLAEKTGAELRTIDIRLAKIETKMDSFATKEDMAKLGVAMQSEINAQTWKLITWVCGFGTALVGITYFLATHVGK